MSLGSIHNQVYFCNIILQTTLPSSSTSFKISFLMDFHWGLKSEFFATVANVRITWTSFRVLDATHSNYADFILYTTRKSSCVTARGVPLTALPVCQGYPLSSSGKIPPVLSWRIPLLSCPGGYPLSCSGVSLCIVYSYLWLQAWWGIPSPSYRLDLKDQVPETTGYSLGTDTHLWKHDLPLYFVRWW